MESTKIRGIGEISDRCWKESTIVGDTNGTTGTMACGIESFDVTEGNWIEHAKMNVSVQPFLVMDERGNVEEMIQQCGGSEME